jgi:hypothetical protein
MPTNPRDVRFAPKADIRWIANPLAQRHLRLEREHKLSKTDLKTRVPKSGKHWSGRRESNPRMQLGKLPFYH